MGHLIILPRHYTRVLTLSFFDNYRPPHQHWTYGDSALAPWKHEHILELESLGVNFDGSVNDTYLKAPSHNKEELWQNVDGCEVG